MNRNAHAACTLTLRPVCHPSGPLMVYTATTTTHIVELYQAEQAEGARTQGSWFLQIRVAGAILGTHSRHFTMAEGRKFATAVLNHTTGPTHAELLAAFTLVDAATDIQADADPASQSSSSRVVQPNWTPPRRPPNCTRPRISPSCSRRPATSPPSDPDEF